MSPRILFPLIAFTFLGTYINPSIDLPNIVFGFPWRLYAVEIVAKMKFLTSLSGYPFVPWFLAFASLAIAMTPFRTARQYGDVLRSWLDFLLLAGCISILCTGTVYINDVVSATQGDVLPLLLYPLMKTILGFFFSGFFIMGQIQLQTPQTDVSDVFDQAERPRWSQ